MRLPAILVAGAVLTLATAATAYAAAPLPAPGETSTVRESVTGAVLRCGGTDYRFDLSGTGTFQQEPLIDSYGGVPVFPVETTDQELTGHSAALGRIRLTEDVPATGELVGPDRADVFPAHESLPIDMKLTLQRDPCAAGAPITLRSQPKMDPGPAILRNSNVTNFPPQNDVYQLVEPMDLEDVNNPGPVLATIQSFPLTVNPPTA